MSDRLVVGLDDLGRSDLDLAGGKGANLGELLRAGFPVPGGFVVTTHAYSLAAECAGLDGRRIAERLAAGAGGGAAIRAQLEAVAVPPEISHAVSTAYAQLGSGPVAVRSSATAEDLPGAAFAGQQDTYLNIIGEQDLLDATRRCWASLWTDRAIAYRQKRGLESSEVRIAVVVQRMVDAESAGVMFTANPVTGARNELVVDASIGLGEAVVSGLVTPDHYVLNENGKLSDWSPGRREVVIRGTSGGGVEHIGHETAGGDDGATHEPVGEPEQLLSNAQLAELARLGTAVAGHFGRPQDIEWAFDSEKLWLLQARPMTALPPPPLPKLNRKQRQLSTVLNEYLPVRPYPIDASTWLPYGPVGMMAKVAENFGIRGAFEDFLVEDAGVVERFNPPSPRPTLRLLTAPFRLAHKASRYDPSRWTEDPRFEAFLKRIEELESLDLSAMSWSELIGTPRQALASIEPLAWFRMDYLPGSAFALLRLALALKLLGEGDRLSVLLGGAPTRTEDANQALEALARKVRANSELERAFAELEPKQLREVLPDYPAFPDHPDFETALREFLVEYGHRETSTPILLTPPTWGESPETVLGLVKVLAANPPTNKPATISDAALDSLLGRPLVKRLGLQGALSRWVEAARNGVAFREDTHFYMTKPLPVLRRSILELGRRLTQVEVLENPEEVFHLRLEEFEAIDDPRTLSESETRDLRTKVRARSAKRDELAGVPLINLKSLVPTHRDAGTALVAGTPASSGIVTGPVRVIRSPAEFAKLRSGDVLVCPYTNPSWTPLFQRAAAVIVDSGGVASHAAIVAREYGIPAVMATVSGTKLLEDDQRVTVDGSTGLVTAASEDGAR